MAKGFCLDYAALHNHDLSSVIDRVSHCGWCVEGFTKSPGEHYKLLSYLADQCKNSLIIDSGTAEGTSAIAFAAHAKEFKNQIVTCDIVDRRMWSFDGLPIKFIHTGINTKPIYDLIKDASIIFVDVDHTGVEEWLFYNKLLKMKFKGLLIVDDIVPDIPAHPMNKFWQKIKTKKYDITKYCHWSGTGIVDFGVGVTFENTDIYG